MLIGYSRVSSDDQSLELQHAALKAAGCARIFEEKLSGKRADTRPELKACLASLQSGDVLVVTKLDRFARSVADLAGMLRELGERGVGFRCLHQAGVDTTTPVGMLITHILGAVAEFERTMILERTAEGIARAKTEGRYKGRKAVIDAAAVVQAAETMSAPDVAEKFGISLGSAYRIAGRVWRRRRDGAVETAFGEGGG